MKVHIQGQGPVDLNQNNFIASGGEGSIYGRSDTAFKIYADPTKMVPAGKIQELSVLTHPNIIKPEGILLDIKNKPIGYTMRLVKDTYSLCQLFTKAFRVRNNISPDMILKLVRDLQDIVAHSHSNNILIVDLNELNFLSSKDFKEIFAIDVDSYQTLHFHATALMESVRDRHSKDFSENTDWFSFAVTAFQMFIGIHPYKGKHPSIKNIDDRMIKNISVFNNEVSVPNACYDFSIIPDSYRQWFKAILEDGKRLAPPSDLINQINLIQSIKKIVGSNNFDIDELESLKHDIFNVLFKGAHKVIVSAGGVHVNRDFFDTLPFNPYIVFTPKSNEVLAASISKNKLELFNISKRQPVSVNIACDSIMEYDDRIYLKAASTVLELELFEMGGGIQTGFKIVGNILGGATVFYEGVAIQNLLGDYYASLFPLAGTCHQVRIKELAGYKIIDAKFDHGILMVVGAAHKTGKTDRFIFKFDEKYTDYSIRITQDIQYSSINFVVLDTGVCIHLTEDDAGNEILELFSVEKAVSKIKVIQDPALSNDMILLKNAAKLMFIKGNKLYSFAMKK